MSFAHGLTARELHCALRQVGGVGFAVGGFYLLRCADGGFIGLRSILAGSKESSGSEQRKNLNFHGKMIFLEAVNFPLLCRTGIIDSSAFLYLKARMQTLLPAELRRWMADDEPFLLVDVRETFERENFNIGGLHLPMSELGSRWQELQQDLPVVLYCAKGIRSAIAIQRLEGVAGMPQMYNLEGGMKGWQEESPLQ